MSVIAKMYAQGSRPISGNTMLDLHCVCENDLMAQYAPSNEDILFSRYSPSGDARLIVAGPAPGIMDGDQFYFIFQKSAEQPLIDGAYAYGRVQVISITDFGGTSKQVQISSTGQPDAGATLLNLNYRIMIDNPAASDQFKAGDTGWWVTIYKASQVTQQEAIALAHAAD